MPTIEIETEQLLNAALQMPEEELKRFVTRLFTLKAGEQVSALSERESELLLKINEGLSPADARRMKELIAKRQSYAITEDELQELIRLTDEAERLNVERMKRLIELAHLRGVTIDEVMEQRILSSFDALPNAAKHEVALKILRGAREFDFPPLTNEELTANAETLFLEFDKREMNDERPESW